MTAPVLLLRNREHKIGLALWPDRKILGALQKAHTSERSMIRLPARCRNFSGLCFLRAGTS